MPKQLSLFEAAPDPTRASLEVLAHEDPFVLEDALADRVEAAKAEDALAPVLVLVPTRILARHVQRRLTRRRPAWLGLDVLSFRGAVRRAHEIPASGPRPRLRAVSGRVLEVLLERVRERLPDIPLMAFTRRRPGGLGGLLQSLKDLREAGVTASALRAIADGPQERDLAQIYSEYEVELERLAQGGLSDEAGWVAQALTGAETLASRQSAILVYGAYELVGMHLDLVRAMAHRAPTTLFLPLRPGSPAGAYGEAFARRHLTNGEDPVTLASGGRGRRCLLGDRLSALYDEQVAPPPLPDGVRVRHVQGAPAEVAVALRHALRAVASGVVPADVALVARTLEPYGPALEEHFAEISERARGTPGPSYFTSFESPLRRAALVHDLLLLLRVLAEDFPRAATVELLRSPRVRWGARPPAGRADVMSRRAGVLGGLSEWTDELQAWADGNARRLPWARDAARGISRALHSLKERIRPERARPWQEHADMLERAIGELLDTAGDSRALEAVLALVDEMRDLGRVPDAASTVSFSKMRGWLERAVDETRLAHQEEDGGGIRVLDAMQARGLTFHRVFVLGLQSNAFPRVPHEDPFLGDDLRRRVRERTGRPLGIKRDGEQEEHLLLSLVLGSAGGGLDVSWQRSDDAGRALAPSLALRELARLVLGRPDMRRLLREAGRVSSHPLARLRELLADPGLLTPAEEDLLIALSGSDPRKAIPTLAERNPHLELGFRLVAATEDFPRPGGPMIDLAYDGVVGDVSVPPEPLSVTAFERLTTCPLRFWFHDVLRVHELDEEATAYGVPAVEMGRRIHAVLETVHRALQDDGMFDPDRRARLVAVGLERLERVWTEQMEDLERRRSTRLAALWALQIDDWRRAVRAFVEGDLGRIAAQGLQATGLEQDRCQTLDLGDGVRVEVTARFDRVLSADTTTLVGDYKTSRRLDHLTDLRRMLRGYRLQVGLYHLIAGEPSIVEVLGVAPWFDYESDHPDPARRIEFRGFGDPAGELRRGFIETLRESLRLARRGEYLLNPDDDHACRWCAYTPACRRTHAPTLERRAVARGASVLDAIREKTARHPTLQGVTGEPG